VLLFVGTTLAFFPMHLLGLDGMVRRIVDYAPNPGWTELNFTSTIGAFIIAISMLPFLWNVFTALRQPRSASDDPWDGYTLEWATTSPPPPYNFDALPPVRSERPLFDLKHGAVVAHAVALPAVAGTTHDETRADAPEENLGEPIEGHNAQAAAGDVQPGVSEAAPDAVPHAARKGRTKAKDADAPTKDDTK
jgi:heme/copper-type cytochrome/quinol oxidase subunit 1